MAGSREGEDYYSVLGCDPSSSEEQIMTEYRIRAKESHPDKMGDTEDFQVCENLFLVFKKNDVSF